MRNPWLGIKQIPGWLVKQRPLVTVPLLLLSIVLGGALTTAPWAPFARADDGTSSEVSPDTGGDTGAGDTSAEDASLPEIDAKTFDATVVRRSTSGHVYLFQSDESLHVGKILLLREKAPQNADSSSSENAEFGPPVMAFRVLRDYPQKNQFAAKWVRRYRGIEQLPNGQDYLAIEKLADREAPPLTEQDQADLKEVESEAPPPPPSSEAQAPAPAPTQAPAPAPSYDPELDATTSPPPKSATQVAQAPDLSAADQAEINDLQNITAEELRPLERDKNEFSLGFGLFRNNGAAQGDSSGYLSGLDMKYARTLKTMVYFRRKNLQDSVAIEGGLGFYRLINFSSSNDYFNVVPITMTLRYTLDFGEDFSAFGYLGFNANVVGNYGTANPSNQSAANTAANQLNSFLPAIGVGALFHVGPGWYIRVDTGLDLIGLGFLLRY